MFYNYASSLSYARYVAEDIKMNSLRSEIMRLSAKIENYEIRTSHGRCGDFERTGGRMKLGYVIFLVMAAANKELQSYHSRRLRNSERRQLRSLIAGAARIEVAGLEFVSSRIAKWGCDECSISGFSAPERGISRSRVSSALQFSRNLRIFHATFVFHNFDFAERRIISERKLFILMSSATYLA